MSIIEIKQILQETQNSLTERKSVNFIGMQTKIQLNKLKNKNPSLEIVTLITKFEEETVAFYNTTFEYLQKYSISFNKYTVFDWMMLSEIQNGSSRKHYFIPK